MQLSHSNNVAPVAAVALMWGLALAANTGVDDFEWAKKPPEQGPGNLNDLARAGAQKAETASWKKIASRRFADVRSLRTGWDGPASVAVADDVIATAERLLDVAFFDIDFPAVPSVVPCGDGSVQLEWRLNDTRFELEIEPNGELAAWALDRSSGLSVERFGADATALFLSWTSRLTADKYTAA